MIASLLVLLLVGGAISFGLSHVKAEQSGSTPESNATSRLITAYNTVVGLGFGSDAAGSWGDWGAKWNRLVSAAEFVLTGNAAVTDVKAGKTFYANTRGQQTGTYPAPGPCSTEAYHDSYGAPVTQTTNCTNNITWTANPSPIAGDDATGMDPRTGLTFSQLILNSSGTPTFSPTTNSTFTWDGTTSFTVTAAAATAGATYTNNGATFTVVTTIAGATTLVTTGTGAATASGTLTKVTGTGDATITFSAISAGASNAAVGAKTAKQICSDRGNGWRLPTQKELMQAYIDGSFFNLTQPSYNFWSSTEVSATVAWFVYLSIGGTFNGYKTTTSYQVRCVR
ncbi:MAG: DUF1566 domain-containing protein [bacterium]